LEKLINQFETSNYCLLPSSFNKPSQEYLKINSNLELLKKGVIEKNNNWTNPNNIQPSIKLYNSNLGISLHKILTPLYSQISKKNLIPSYSFIRKYYQNNLLPPHIDRPSCQYSATLQLDRSKDKPWKFNLLDITKTYSKIIEIIDQKIGDIILYKGEKLLHWRLPLEYEWSTHLFLHWVDGDDPNYKEYQYDQKTIDNISSADSWSGHEEKLKSQNLLQKTFGSPK